MIKTELYARKNTYVILNTNRVYTYIYYIYIYNIYIYIYISPYITILRLGMREVNLLKFVQCLENIRQEKWRIFVMFDWMFMVVKERYLNIICDNVESF